MIPEAIHRDNLPQSSRLAMIVAYQLFDRLHGDTISRDSMSSHGVSWHEFYKGLVLDALEDVSQDGRVINW